MPAHLPPPDADCEALADALEVPPAVPGTPPPPPPTRAAGLLSAGDRLATRLDALLERALPRAVNPLAQLGPAVNAMIVLAVASGVAMLLWYSASLPQAWSSLAGLGPRSLGGIVRSLHRYSSDLLMLLVLAHAFRTLLARKFADARWLAWVSGVAMLGLVWFIGWTGYWLVWDVRAQLLALDTIRALDVLPVFGEPLLRLYASDRTVPSLFFFVVFFLHMVLPLGIAVGLGLHVARLSRARLLPDWRLSAWLAGAVLLAALVFPAVNAAPAAMAVKPAAFTMDWWYLWPLAVTRRLSGGGVWLAAFGAAAGFMTVPWWLARRRRREVFQAKVDVSRCFACTLCSHDCPFGAITMVPRTDGKPFPSQAQVDPDRCIGCGVCAGACDTQGIGLPWLDARTLMRTLEAGVAADVARGERPALAFVCSQGDGGAERFQTAAWTARLPGYAIHPVPCAGWIEPKLVERLLGKGAFAVLIIGCASGEAFCKEGNQWMSARLAGTREPALRPERVDPSRVAYVTFDPNRPSALTALSVRLRDGGMEPGMMTNGTGHAPTRFLAGAAILALGIAALLGASAAPFRDPASQAPEFVFAFRANGEWLDASAIKTVDPEHDDRPVHMRTVLPMGRTRAAVTVRIAIDGQAMEQTVKPKGVKSDGLSVGEIRLPLGPGRHRVEVGLATGPGRDAPVQSWSAPIEARPGRVAVLSYDPVHGFEFEP
jgi:ferredoxin/coenzyme F420-reducing hydrogenase delta subunit